MMWGFTSLSDADLARYVKEDLSVLHDFILNARLNSQFVGWISRGEIVKVLRINWPIVESLLLKWTSLRDEIRKHGKGQILFTNRGAQWFYKQTKDFYVYLSALCYDFYCLKCGYRITKPHEPLIAAWNRQRTKLLGLYHIQCVVSKKELESAVRAPTMMPVQ